MKHITEKQIYKLRKLRKIFANTPTDLLKEDLKNLPEYRTLIENELMKR